MDSFFTFNISSESSSLSEPETRDISALVTSGVPINEQQLSDSSYDAGGGGFNGPIGCVIA